MQDVNPASLVPLVAWGAFALAFVFGFVGNRTNFCTMGAVSDIVNMGDWNRMRMWLLAIAVAILGSNALELAGILKLSNSIYPGPNFTWLSYIVGGLLFGIGMTLGSGCGSKTLIRVGGGNLKSLVVLVFMAIAAYMTLRGLFGAVRVAVLEPVSVQLAGGQDLPSLFARWFGAERRPIEIVTALVVGGGLAAFALARREFRQFDYLLGGIVVGLVIVGGWYVSGRLGYVAEDPNTLQEAFVATNTGRMESLSFVAPQAFLLELLMFWTDKSRIVTFGIASALGVIAGSARVRARVEELSSRVVPRRERHAPSHRRRDPDGLRRHRRARVHDRAGHHRLLDARARLDPDVRGDRRRVGGDDEIRVLAADARDLSA